MGFPWVTAPSPALGAPLLFQASTPAGSCLLAAIPCAWDRGGSSGPPLGGGSAVLAAMGASTLGCLQGRRNPMAAGPVGDLGRIHSG